MANQLSSWPRPTSVWKVPSVPIRTPLPIYPPPKDKLGPLPPLPTPQRQPNVHPSFVLSTHLVPAAHLRTTRHVPPPPASMMPGSEDKGLSKKERIRKLMQVKKWLENVRGSDIKGKTGYERVLWVCVNRYRRVDLDEVGNGKRRGFTLFFAHGTGFPKEIWEPTLKHLLTSHAHVVDEVWAWEAVNHGDAALVNGEALSPLYDWMDNARDILNFFTYFIPSSASSKPLPTHLPRVSMSESDKRAIHGIQTRDIVCVGHSFGGCTTTMAALFNPNLFIGLTLVDAVIIKPLAPGEVGYPVGEIILNSLSRRETWKSRSEALALFKQSPFFASWTPEALEVYAECGLYTSSDAQGKEIVKLKMPCLIEASVFAEIHSSQEVYTMMPTLNSKIRLRWVIPVENPLDVGPPGSTQQRVWLRPANSSNVRIPGAGHLITQEKPNMLADDMGSFLNELRSEKLLARL